MRKPAKYHKDTLLSMDGYVNCPMIRATILHCMLEKSDEAFQKIWGEFHKDIGVQEKLLKRFSKAISDTSYSVHRFWGYDKVFLATLKPYHNYANLQKCYLMSLAYDESEKLKKLIDDEIKAKIVEFKSLSEYDLISSFYSWSYDVRYFSLFEFYNSWLRTKVEVSDYLIQRMEHSDKEILKRYKLEQFYPDGQYPLSSKNLLKVFDIYSETNISKNKKEFEHYSLDLIVAYLKVVTVGARSSKAQEEFEDVKVVYTSSKKFCIKDFDISERVKNLKPETSLIALFQQGNEADKMSFDTIMTKRGASNDLYSVLLNLISDAGNCTGFMQCSEEKHLYQEVLLHINSSISDIDYTFYNLIKGFQNESISRLQSEEGEAKRLELQDLRTGLSRANLENAKLLKRISELEGEYSVASIDELNRTNTYLTTENEELQETIAKQDNRITKLLAKLEKANSQLAAYNVEVKPESISLVEQELSLEEALLTIAEFIETTKRRVIIVGGIEKWRVMFTQNIKESGLFEKGMFLALEACNSSIDQLTSDDVVICQIVGMRHCDKDYLDVKRSILNFDFTYTNSVNFTKAIRAIAHMTKGKENTYHN